MKEEKFGTIVADGKIYNLDMMESEELNKLEEKLSVEEEKIRNEIDSIIGLGNEEA